MKAAAVRSGFSLVEVLVALVVFQVGLVGVAGLNVLATRSLASAASMERLVALAEEVADSLARVASPAEGTRESPAGRVEWWIAPGSDARLVRIEIVATDPNGRRLVDARGILPSDGSGGKRSLDGLAGGEVP